MTRYIAGRIIFGEGPERWSVPDPTDARHSEGRHSARYSQPHHISAADQAEAFTYLAAICATTDEAVAKLRQIRRAIREKP